MQMTKLVEPKPEIFNEETPVTKAPGHEEVNPKMDDPKVLAKTLDVPTSVGEETPPSSAPGISSQENAPILAKPHNTGDGSKPKQSGNIQPCDRVALYVCIWPLSFWG
jgi:hypothetical protein